MKSKNRYTKNDRVLVKSFAGPSVCVVLKKRYIVSKSKHKLGVDGWEAQITNQKEVEKLRKDLWEYKRHPRGLGNGIWFVSDYMIANIRGEFSEYYHTWMRVRQGEFEFENERKSRD